MMSKPSKAIVFGLISSYLRGLFTLVFIFITITTNADARKDRDSILNLPLFKNEGLLEFELKSNWQNVLIDIAEKRSYHKCRLQITDGDEIRSFETEVKTRGNFRRRKQNCNFPPLRFKFNSQEVIGTEFEGQHKLKYVSHCQNSDIQFDQNAIEEYLVYKMYNLIDEHSYRVRLTKISFIDTITNDTIQRFGFFLEDKKDIAIRTGKKILQYKNMKQYNVLHSNMIMLNLFQLMIGNADWDVERLHNIDIMSVDEQSIPMAIPYDFDWSGIINHTYFKLHPKITEDDKYKRIYKGYNWGKDEFDRAFVNFRELRESFLGLITGCEHLNSENQAELIAYILKFYELIDSKKDVKTYILKKSHKIPISK